jgi:hypothetical protein
MRSVQRPARVARARICDDGVAMRRRLPALALVALAALTATAAPSRAGSVTIGSDLSERAGIAQSHPRDWAAWPTAIASGGGVTAPVQGAVSIVQFKGTVLKAPSPAYNGQYPPFNFLVVVLRPQPGGGEKLMVATQDLPFPFGGDDQQITTFDLQQYDANICVKPGDHVALATSGGFGNSDPAFGGFPDDYYADGYPVKMFARVPGSSVSVFEQPVEGAAQGFQVGDVESGAPRPDQELLMRATIATGNDAQYSCRTAEEQQGPTVRFPEQAFRLKVRKGKAGVQLSCVSLAACPGTLYLKLNDKILVGSGAFSLQGKQTATVPVTLNPNGVRKLRERKGRMRVSAIARPKGGKQVASAFKLVR